MDFRDAAGLVAEEVGCRAVGCGRTFQQILVGDPQSPALAKSFFTRAGPSNSPKLAEKKPTSFLSSLQLHRPTNRPHNSRRRQNGCHVCASSLNPAIWAGARSRVLLQIVVVLSLDKSRSPREALTCQLDLSWAAPSIAQAWNTACVLRDVAWGVGDEDCCLLS